MRARAAEGAGRNKWQPPKQQLMALTDCLVAAEQPLQPPMFGLLKEAPKGAAQRERVGGSSGAVPARRSLARRLALAAKLERA
jgi:hypothetical protein